MTDGSMKRECRVAEAGETLAPPPLFKRREHDRQAKLKRVTAHDKARCKRSRTGTGTLSWRASRQSLAICPEMAFRRGAAQLR